MTSSNSSNKNDLSTLNKTIQAAILTEADSVWSE